MTIFRCIPPLELVEQVLKGVGLSSINDTTSFTKESVRLDLIEGFIPELEPYYIPCKATLVQSPLTQASCISIIRQLVKAHGASFKSVEKSRNCVKGVYYSIRHCLKNEFHVDFS